MGIYAWVVRAGPAALLVIALVNFLGSVSFMLSAPRQQGLWFALSAALSSTLIPLIAASVLLRFDQWLASRHSEAGA